MTRQSETAGFGPRPRWRRFHQGALALALALALAVAAALAGSALLVAAALAPASAQTRMVEIGENKVGGVRVTQGKSQTLQTTLGFVDLVVGDPEIADVMPLTTAPCTSSARSSAPPTSRSTMPRNRSSA